MADIIKTREDLIRLKRSFEMIKAIGFNREAVEYALLNILPRNDKGLMVRYRVRDWGGKPGNYIPYLSMLDMSVEKCQEFVVLNASDLENIYAIRDREEFELYLSLFIIVREAEKAYQHLIGEGRIEAPCKLVQDGYKALGEVLVKPNRIIPHPVKDVKRMVSLVQYMKKPNSYVLERNANVEGFNALRVLAHENKNEEMLKVFNDMTRTSMTIGYETDTSGCFYHTFKDLHMMREFNKMNITEGMTMRDRIFYGVDIDENAREQLLSLAKRRTV